MGNPCCSGDSGLTVPAFPHLPIQFEDLLSQYSVLLVASSNLLFQMQILPLKAVQLPIQRWRLEPYRMSQII